MNILELLVESKLEYLVKAQGPKLELRAKADTHKQMSAPDVLAKLAEADPTGGQHKFLQWIVNQYLKGQFKLEDVSRIKVDLSEFLRVRSQLEKKDINQYKTLSELYDVLDPLEGEEVVSKRQQDKVEGDEYFESGQAVLITNTDGVKIIKLASKDASCYFGRGTRWCTAAREDNMFEEYNKQGPLFVVIVDGTKYQFHFESGQYMDAQDRELSKDEIQSLLARDPVRKLVVDYTEVLAERLSNMLNSNETDWDTREAVSSMVHTFGQMGVPMTDMYRAFIHHPDQMAGFVESLEIGRVPEAEELLLRWASKGLNQRGGMIGCAAYAITVIRGPWPEYEKIATEQLSNPKLLDVIVLYCRKIGHRWPELEAALLKGVDTLNGAALAVRYASFVMRGEGWPEIEKSVSKFPAPALDYAEKVIQRRWPEGEEAILGSFLTKNDYLRFLRRIGDELPEPA